MAPRWKSGPWRACLLPTLQDAQRESRNWSTRPSRHSGSGPEALFSTLGRIAARAIEAQVLVELMDMWVQGLADNMGRRDYRIQDNSKWDPSTWPADCFGYGFHEAPRGALGHWVHINKGSIANYQCVVPSTWNAGPRDAKGQPGPYEAALVGHACCQAGAASGDPAHGAFL